MDEVDQGGPDEEMCLQKSPGTAWFQVHESNGSFEARREFHGCGRISMCGVWSLGLSKLSGPSCKPVRLQTLEEMAAVCSLLPGRVLTWLFSSAQTLPCALAIPREHA